MRRRVGLFLVFGAVLPLAAASVAWACGVLATLTLDKKVAAPGQAITATGKNFSSTGTAVTIRLKSRSGTVLATTAANAGGKIDATFPVPASISPGWYSVMALQNTDKGVPKSGTPARTTLRIAGSRKQSAVAAPWSSSEPAGPSGQSALPMILAIVLSLSMLAAGWTLVGRRSRTVAGPQLGV